MKVKFTESFRMRVMLYTCISLLAAVLTDLTVLFLCIRSRILVSDYGLNNMNIHAGNNNYVLNNSRIQASTKSMLSESNIFYRIFGVGIKVQLIIILIILALVVFLLVFFALTHQVTGYITTILQGACKMADGDFSHRIDVRYQDEFSCIADSINRMADTVETMKKKEEEAEETKNELITNVAHDLRTPLTSILGYLDLLTQGGFLTEEQKQKYLGIVSSKAKQLETLVKDLFDYTRYDKNKVKIKKEILDLNLFVPQLVDEFYPSFMDHKLECRTDFYEWALNIEGNGELLARAIGNLISNAIKYGVDGKLVEVHTGLKDKMAFVAIVNYGKIIPAEDLDKIFDKFYRVENSRSLKTGGTGLGLAIAKNIVNLHEGEIWATSDESGTRFQIELPVVQAHAPKAGK